MKMRTHIKGKGITKVNTQKAISELKHRVVHALNKLADRDTYQIGVEELEKIAEGLTPEGVAPFLSCILDTEAEQKSAVRKECIRIMGNLVHFHERLLAPHLGKMVVSIVKRLKDPDSVVRDACVETVGVFALKMCNSGGESDGAFVVLVKPLFEALGEQNRQVQSGSSLCLAKVIDNTNEPPVSLLLRMLPRAIKLLKNPHFIAKPAVIELIRSIIQAGGAPTQNALADALTSIQDALKSSDWTTRKSASVTLGGIAVNGGSLLGPFKASCIRSLESCRFDKVKPVRDSVLQALQFWKSNPGPDSPEPSEAGSFTKENFCGVDSDLTSASDCGWKDIGLKKVGTSALKKRVPLTVQKTCSNHVENPKQSKANDWNIEIAVPKGHSVSLADAHNEESQSKCVTKTLGRTDRKTEGMRDIGYYYMSVDEKPECSSAASNPFIDNLETKSVTVGNDGLEEGGLMNSVTMNQMSVFETNHMQHQTYSERMQECRSLDSTVTELSLRSVHGCCSQTANEMAFIKKQLLEIENKQSNLMDLLQEFMGSTLGSLSMLQSKVLGLEDAVDKIDLDFHRRSYTNMETSKILKTSQSVLSSPRLSTCSSRPSVDITNRQSSQLSIRGREVLEEAAFGKGKSSTYLKQGLEMSRDPTVKMFRNLTSRGIQRSFGHAPQSCQTGKNGVHSALAGKVDASQNSVESDSNLWKHVKDFLRVGDLDSAFVEVICSGDNLVLIELLDRTGPILESLSHETIHEILSTLVAHFLDHRFMDSIMPWLQQVVDLSTTQGPDCLGLSMKAKREFLSALQEAAAMDFLNPVERRSVTQYALKLRQIWGKS